MSGGRKIEFDKEKALAAAMHVFWKKGFGGASLSDLTESMGINKPSMYATFGNKEALFIKATEHYVESIAKSHGHYLHQENTPLKVRLKNYLMSVVTGQCGENNPKGCYITLCVSEAEGDAIPEAALTKITEASQFNYNYLSTLFVEDKEAQELGLNTDADGNARFLMTILNGTAAMARAGLAVSELEPVVDRALKGLGL